jgi:hypothetical protein
MKALSLWKILIIFVFIAVAHQNCGTPDSVQFSNTSKPSLISSAQTGGGDSYEGKPTPGDYVRTLIDYACQAQQGVQALLEISATQGTLTKDNCALANYVFGFNEPGLIFAKYNPDYLSLGSAVFERISNSTVDHINEGLCQFKDANLGMDVVMTSDLTGGSKKAKIYFGDFNKNQNAVTNLFGVQSTLSGQTLSYTSTTLDFNLQIDKNSFDGQTYQANLETTLDNVKYSLTTSCRLMNPNPVLYIDPTGLLAYFKFDESSLTANGAIVNSGNGTNFTFNAPVSSVNLVSGKSGNALDLNSSQNQYFLTNSNSLPASNTVTISYWHRFPAPLSTVSFVFSAEHSPTGQHYLRTGVDSSAGGTYFGNYFNPADPGQDRTLYSTVPAAANVWHHVVVTMDSSNVTTYLDGNVLVSENRFSPTTDVMSPIDRIWLGQVGGGAQDNGTLDELSIWNRSLSPSEVKILYSKIVIK